MSAVFAVCWLLLVRRTAPPEFLQGDKQDAELTGVDATLIVFINTRSGGRVGTELARVLARAVQVGCSGRQGRLHIARLKNAALPFGVESTVSGDSIHL